MFKKIQKLIKTPNIYFYDMFAKRLNKPVYAKTVAAKAQSNKLAASKKVENLQHTDLETIIRQVQGNISLNTKILSKLTKGTLYNNNKEISSYIKQGEDIRKIIEELDNIDYNIL